MPRLNKALKELNVGINTVAEFLQKKNRPLQDASPNAKITDEQYELLMDAFGADKTKHEEIQKQLVRDKQERERLKQEKKQKQETIYRTTSESKQQFKVLGNINDMKKEEPATAKEEASTVKAAQPAEIVETAAVVTPEPEEVVKETTQEPKEQDAAPATPVQEEVAATQVDESEEATEPSDETETGDDFVDGNDEDESEVYDDADDETETASDFVDDNVEAEPEKGRKDKKSKSREIGKVDEDGVFRTNTPTTGVKQVGYIDLSNLNSKTRPDKKSKAEKKKEREEKERQRKEAMAANRQGEGESSKKRKRNRIGKEKVDINAEAAQQTTDPRKKKKQQQQQAQQAQQAVGKKKKKSKGAKVQELTDEEISKQVKETLARLTSKQMKKGVKYRKDKREAIHNRMAEMEEEENEESKILKLTEYVTANELATMMNVPVTQVIATCMQIGIMVSINQRLDAETINIVAEEFGYSTTYVSEDVSNAIEEEADAEEDLQPRAPIITVMGHVDHGKTSLLDYIRKTNVIAGEAGGITQHIGAYSVELNGQKITFLDTPGHEAFTAMRARGAKITDVAIIIVAADDSVMPQTIEAINHAQAAGVPMVFAINKIDKPQANPEHIKEQLSAMNYLVESWGGKYQDQEISAKKGLNLDKLLEKVLLEAEMLELKANPDKRATGSVIESTLDKGRGYVSTILVQSGTLRVGDVILSGTFTGRVKAMFNENGKKVQEAGPSTPVQVLGLNGAPQAGDSFNVMEDDRSAREIANKREQLQRMQGIMTQKHVTLDEIGRRIAIGSFKELNIIVKGDVDGSVEAMSGSLIKLSKETVQVNVIHAAVGQISESDVLLAAASNAIIVGFQVRPSASARKLAEKEEIEIRLYSIIYDAINDIKDAIEGMLEPVMKEEIVASVEVLETFKISKVGTIAGGIVREGKIGRNTPIRVIRDGIVIYTGKLGSLKRFKDDVKEVTSGMDCGLNIESFNDIKVGDIIEGYEQVEVKRK